MKHLHHFPVNAARPAALSRHAMIAAAHRRTFVLVSEELDVAFGRENDRTVRRRCAIHGHSTRQVYVPRGGQTVAATRHCAGLDRRDTALDTDNVNAFASPSDSVTSSPVLLSCTSIPVPISRPSRDTRLAA